MDLNPEQRRAVEAVRGPVCILAGAGSGKTTTITHRIANQVATGTFAAPQILAVTFTDKAAGELRGRLEGLGVTGVRASTFHSAALSQLRYFRPEAVGKICAAAHRPEAVGRICVDDPCAVNSPGPELLVGAICVPDRAIESFR